MKWVALMTMAVLVVSCSKAPVRVTGLNLPELDSSDYYDSPYRSGWVLLRDGRPKEAMDQFQRSQVEDGKLHVAFGYVFLMQRKYRLAQKNFSRALILDPESIRARVGMANLYEVTGDEDKAFAVYAALRAEFPDQPWIKHRYEYLKTTRTDWYLHQADEYRTRGDEEGYLQSLIRAAEFSPELTGIQRDIADSYFERGDYAEAATYYEDLSHRIADNRDILARLGEAYEETGQYDAAIITYKRLLENNPGDKDLINKINDLKIRFYDVELPVKFKNIFFKYNINREDLAALVGHYFDRFLPQKVRPVIITDISGSYARQQIVRLCSLGIMDVRPDHGFDRRQDVTRAALAKILYQLKEYLVESGRKLNLTFRDDPGSPQDVSPRHLEYRVIRFAVNTGMMNLDKAGRFNPTAEVPPAEALMAIRKLLFAVEKR